MIAFEDRLWDTWPQTTTRDDIRFGRLARARIDTAESRGRRASRSQARRRTAQDSRARHERLDPALLDDRSLVVGIGREAPQRSRRVLLLLLGQAALLIAYVVSFKLSRPRKPSYHPFQAAGENPDLGALRTILARREEVSWLVLSGQLSETSGLRPATITGIRDAFSVEKHKQIPSLLGRCFLY